MQPYSAKVLLMQRDRLALLLDALGDVPVSDSERASLLWLAGFEVDTVSNVAAVIARTRQTAPAQR